jgi:SecD/SecF fusion protein
MRNLPRHLILILLIVGFVGYQVFPPDQQLRRAKDLAGGASLVYQVELKPSDPADTMDRVKEVLQRRVDPDGVLDISMVTQGTNRIEVSMPLATGEVKELRRKFEEQLTALGEGAITGEQLQRKLELPAGERTAALAAIAAGDKGRQELLDKAASAWDNVVLARKEFNDKSAGLNKAVDDAKIALDSATSAGKPAEELAKLRETYASAQAARDLLARTAASSELAYEAAEKAALATAITASDVRRALELPGKGRTFNNPDGTTTTIPSPRERALERLRTNYPGAKDRLDQLVASYNQYTAARKTLDDPQDLVRLLRGAGVLTFRIAPRIGELGVGEEQRLREELRQVGPRSVKSETVRWYKVNKVEGWLHTDSTPADLKEANENPASFFARMGRYIVDTFDGQAYMLCYDVAGQRLTQAEGNWRVSRASASADANGQPTIAFEMDALGAQKMAQLTSSNTGKAMAVLLDDQVYTAPNIQSTIGASGQITGSFTPEERMTIIRTLGAGSLGAKLSPEPISISTIGPQLGADNLKRGFYAGMAALIVVAGFMILYYFGCGLIAVFALLINGLLILGLMAMLHAAFSLPGIAGLVLTFGMAVDANVLIYERMREEMERGADFRTAVRLGYSRAMSSIIDGNMTTLIVSAVLVAFGTTEIKGFGTVMIIGGLTTLFTQLYVTRVLFAIFVEKMGWRHGTLLAVKFPAIARAFHPHVDWMKYRYAMLGVSATLVIASCLVVINRGSDLFDNDFRGGTKVSFDLKKGTTLERAQVETRLKERAEKMAASGTSSLAGFEPQVLVIDPVAGSSTQSNRFTIKTVVTDTPSVIKLVTGAMEDVLDIQPVLKFAGADAPDARSAPVKPILHSTLGESIDRPNIKFPTGDWIGGAAIVVADITPVTNLQSLQDRLALLRNEPQYSQLLTRSHQWVVLEGTDDAVRSAALLVRDNNVSYLVDQARWSAEVRDAEWGMLSEAMKRQKSLASVESFSASIAGTFVRQALVAVLISSVLITIYLWVRFQSFRYSFGALLATLHDCAVAVGCLAVCKYIAGTSVGHALGLEPFKIDLNVVAAVLTILGYSLNDTVIVMDRIREHRGKLPYATRAMVNDAVNQTISRTVITSGLTLAATMCLYLFGGDAIRPFAFTFLVGVITGTYSSVFIAAPIVWSHKDDPTHMGGATLNGTSQALGASTNGTKSATVAH